MSYEVEIGRGKRGRRAYSLDDIAVVPSRRTRDPELVSVSWQIDAYHFDLPVLSAPMDSVVSPATAIAIGRLGGLGVLDLEGLWTRYEDPEPVLADIAALTHDTTGRRLLRLANGGEASALEVQEEYLERAKAFVAEEGVRGSTDARVLDLWERGLRAVREQDLSLVDRELDWVIKLKLLERYQARHDLPLSDARVARLDLAYHDLSRRRGLYNLLAARGMVDRLSSDIEVFEATSRPPQTTRARLRGDFVRTAQEKRRDFTVDWVHLKLNDQSQRTVLCKDPFRSVDERVERLISSM